MMIWDLDPAVWRVRACEAAGRNLTHDEWTKFLPEGEPYHVTCPQYPAGGDCERPTSRVQDVDLPGVGGSHGDPGPRPGRGA